VEYDHIVFAPLPEPESWACVLVGLGVIGSLALRHSSKNRA
jgi:hypothetical protein